MGIGQFLHFIRFCGDNQSVTQNRLENKNIRTDRTRPENIFMSKQQRHFYLNNIVEHDFARFRQ